MLCGHLNGKEIQKEQIYVYLDFPVVKKLPVNAGNIRDTSSIPGLGDLLEKEMTTHPSNLAWKIPWTEEPGGL